MPEQKARIGASPDGNPGFTRIDIERLFTYHPPSAGQRVHYEKLRDAARAFAVVLVEHTPNGADQSAAIRKLRECVNTANASIAVSGWE